MIRCTKCILPENYPGIRFDDKGVCQYCNEYKETEYIGLEPLVKEINNFNSKKKDRNKDYDCMIGFSGGRDSTYLLYLLTKKLGLKVLAFSADNSYTTETAKLNMKNAAKKANATLVIEESPVKKSLKHVISSWMHRPVITMVETFCTGCRLGYNRVINYALKQNIPVVVWGSNNFEHPDFKYRLMGGKPDGGWYSMALGYFNCVAKNPRWLMNLNYVKVQINDFRSFSNFRDHFRKKGLLFLEPFKKNIRWVEKTVESTIKNKMDWGKNPNVTFTWRGDCDIALLKSYTYHEILGWNDKVFNLSNLVRDNQISRNEALKRLKNDEKIDDKIIKETLNKNGLSFSDFKNATNKGKKYFSKGILR